MLAQLQAASVDQERHRDEAERHARHRASIATRVEGRSLSSRFGAAISRIGPRDRHSLTTYPCRLPGGKIGLTAVVLRGGEWTFVCRVA